jgi:hypothetical protein
MFADPDGQSLHDDCPVVSEYEPAAQGVHAKQANDAVPL